jgi:acetyl-CoA/propionyl-CoA carboxylase, biotin carboxylase, biotin carboxyl carrier protein
VFSTVLIANRGEIAVRVTRTLRRLGIRAAVVYSDADVDARHVHEADVAVRVGPAEAALSYLDIDAVVAAAVSVGAEAVHPGYGFLSENAAFARACEAAGLVFVGPPASAIEAMGDKIRAKQTVEAAGVAVVPGVHTPGLTDADLVAAADTVGFPVLLKPSAGGGGKGMRRVDDAADLPDAVASARREARTAFGDDTLFVERFVDRPRHIEVQVLADSHGTVLHLGERECSLQRRHQKIVEEAPSPLLTEDMRAAIGASAVRTAEACGYVGAGTVEFIVGADRPDEFFFMEMNTRLQVEHPVTELVIGRDLVECQLRVAAGERLPWTQGDIRLVGHAIEARIYAEDPARGFLPTGGTVLRLREPSGEHVRVDSGISAGSVVGSSYDPMLAKVIAWGAGRGEALARLDEALAETVILGVTTNTGFVRALLGDPDVVAGRLDTGLVERVAPPLTSRDVPGEVFVAAAMASLVDREAERVSDDPFDTLADWRLGGPAWVDHRWVCGDQVPVTTSVRGSAAGAEIRLDGEVAVASSVAVDGGDLLVSVGGRESRWAYASAAGVRWFGRGGSTWSLREAPAHVARAAAVSNGAGPLLAPMPGTLTVVHVAVGDQVVEGQPVVSVEAMKMEHVVRASGPGVVESLPVPVGRQVALDDVVAVLTTAPTPDPPS